MAAKKVSKKKPKRVKVTKAPEKKLSKYQLFCVRVFGERAKKLAEKKPRLERTLVQARKFLLPEEYIACALMSGLIAAISGIALVVLSVILLPLLKLPTTLAILGIPLPILLGVMTYTLILAAPGSKAGERKRDLDRKLPHAMNFISAMASADVNLNVIFRELAKEKIYGEIAKEASWITRDVEVLGKDILTALREAIERSPSMTFQDFLQGVITTSSSGGRLKPYFVLKAKQYMEEHRLKTKKFNEFLGMLAESFVTVVVVFPLLLIVVLSVMALMAGGAAGGGGGGGELVFLYLIAFMMVPASQFGFIFVIKTSSPEVG